MEVALVMYCLIKGMGDDDDCHSTPNKALVSGGQTVASGQQARNADLASRSDSWPASPLFSDGSVQAC